ncbi:hypothetical protein Xen7305DRAFT_00045550 [Xenococcus sp. PCC 7305]|uniref:hypothetical protein n=1 Tax=Xenococcus sp. PCC 7305 TaxID=102125 RepID=UPI0002ABA1AF|nr:hypothetical protein [Xenococcus sp. PCC 7305]ELS04819.1 hypothetical protein Xen7305DRAFT_00045550 [Xenococcus sp. PCC 7305]
MNISTIHRIIKNTNLSQFGFIALATILLGLTTISYCSYALSEPINNDESINWYDLWDTGSNETIRTFTNVNNSGIDVTVEYSTNQIWQQKQNHNGLNLYDNYSPKKHSLNYSHDLWLYHGILRLTNNPNDTGNDSAWVKVTFSEPVTIEQLWAGNLSTINSYREWLKISAYSIDDINVNDLSSFTSALVPPSKVDDYQDFFNVTCNHTAYNDSAEEHKCNMAGADDPNYIGILPNDDGSVTLKGLGSQSSNEYGRTFFEYNTSVQTIVFEHFTTDIDSDTQRNSSYTSVAISPNISFTPSNKPIIFAD